jgi:hypothetical protein
VTLGEPVLVIFVVLFLAVIFAEGSGPDDRDHWDE